MYTDDAILTFGKYKFTKLKQIPFEYLDALSKSCRCIPFPEEFNKYVEQRRVKADPIEVLKSPEVGFVCEKITYANQKIAKIALKRIRNICATKGGKAPIRTYECEKCSGWHLTSKPLLKHIHHA